MHLLWDWAQAHIYVKDKQLTYSKTVLLKAALWDFAHEMEQNILKQIINKQMKSSYIKMANHSSSQKNYTFQTQSGFTNLWSNSLSFWVITY